MAVNQSAVLNVQEVELTPVEDVIEEVLSDKIIYNCAFCGKGVDVAPDLRQWCERLSGNDAFYCASCLRNELNMKKSKDILVISFRGIIGFLYYAFYAVPSSHSRKISYSEIKDIIRSHERVGLYNPVFSYDPDSYLWFIDFSKVGKGRKKIKLKDVLKTITNILACFNLYERLYNIKMCEVYEKYEEAVTKFYEQRSRPPGRKLCVPTLYGCGFNDTYKHFTYEDTRQFTPSDFVL